MGHTEGPSEYQKYLLGKTSLLKCAEDCIERKKERKRREKERTLKHGCYFIHSPFTQVTVEDIGKMER